MDGLLRFACKISTTEEDVKVGRLLSTDAAGPAAADRTFGRLFAGRFDVAPQGDSVDIHLEGMSALSTQGVDFATFFGFLFHEHSP